VLLIVVQCDDSRGMLAGFEISTLDKIFMRIGKAGQILNIFLLALFGGYLFNRHPAKFLTTKYL